MSIMYYSYVNYVLQLCNIYVDFRERTLTLTKLHKYYVFKMTSQLYHYSYGTFK